MDNKSVLYQLMDTRMGEALHKITKEDTAFMQTKEKADEYAAKLASLNLGFSDCKELLLGSCHIPEMKDED